MTAVLHFGLTNQPNDQMERNHNIFYLDKTISSVKQDKLNREHFTNVLANALQRENSDEAFTVGIYGRWGVGKSSLNSVHRLTQSPLILLTFKAFCAIIHARVMQNCNVFSCKYCEKIPLQRSLKSCINQPINHKIHS
jgi:hypothetical protein